MKLLCIAVSFLGLASLVQCVHDSGQRIPPGIYEEPSGQERVIAKDKTLEFEVRLVGGMHQGEVTNDEFSYEVLTTAEIHVISSSSGAAFMEGVVRYHWSWDGNQIIRERIEPSRDEKGNVIATKLGPPMIFARR